MKNLYYIRHGQSQANIDEVWGTDSPLTETGVEQAELAGRKVAGEHFKPDIIITSPLQRAQNTAKIVAEAIGYPLEKLKTDPQLIERKMGDLDGKPFGIYGGPGTKEYRNLETVATVEGYEQLQIRAKAYLEEIKKMPEDTILLVGHAAFGRCLRRVIAGQPYSDEYDKDFNPIPNAEIFKLI